MQIFVLFHIRRNLGGVAFRVTSNKVKEKMKSMGKIKIVEKDEARGTVSVRMHA